ncbi:MAG TPA: class I SAM-dependent methyltransferase, partial [Bryobacteraceae bacterium]|nr:class I SAM-dependent methyltransferase [Bryobacteraceae bacterium]
APWYRWIEYAALGRALERRRFAFLRRLAGARRVLILGEGDGRTVSRLLKIAPRAEFDVVEVSPEMIGLARMRVHDSPRVHFEQGDARSHHWAAGIYDGLVTNFFLDCFTEEELAPLAGKLANALAPDGIWIVAEFAIPLRGWRRFHARMWIWTMYRFFGITTGLRAQRLPAIERLMREAGMMRVEQQSERAGLMVSEVWRR